jgi:hypothetical protein
MKVLGIITLLGIAIVCQSCMAGYGYVDTEPTYTVGIRPMQPSNSHIWIDGDWVYNRSNQRYVRNEGYWALPNRNRTFVPGRWEKSQRGNRWVAGRWQRGR